MVLQAIKYTRGSLEIIDQLQLPHKEVYFSIHTTEGGWHAIKEMRVRGAPAIAIVAALSLAVDLTRNKDISPHGPELRGRGAKDASLGIGYITDYITTKLEYLVTSRPTAVNLSDAAKKLGDAVKHAKGQEKATIETVADTYVRAAEQMLVDDVRDNERIGAFGAQWILKKTERGGKGKVGILTHCNTGYATSLLGPQLDC